MRVFFGEALVQLRSRVEIVVEDGEDEVEALRRLKSYLDLSSEEDTDGIRLVSSSVVDDSETLRVWEKE